MPRGKCFFTLAPGLYFFTSPLCCQRPLFAIVFREGIFFELFKYPAGGAFCKEAFIIFRIDTEFEGDVDTS